MNALWSYLLMIVGVSGIYLAGKQNSWGWAVGLIAQFLWIVYAVVTRQWGFIISAVVYGFFYGKNFVQWRPSRQVQRAGNNSIQIQAGRDINC